MNQTLATSEKVENTGILCNALYLIIKIKNNDFFYNLTFKTRAIALVLDNASATINSGKKSAWWKKRLR